MGRELEGLVEVPPGNVLGKAALRARGEPRLHSVLRGRPALPAAQTCEILKEMALISFSLWLFFFW